MKQVQDHYFHKAKAEGYRSRAAYKLLEIQEKRRLLRAGMRVLDVGAAPGSWTQVAAAIVGARGAVVAVDLKAIDPQGMPTQVRLMECDLRDLDLQAFGGQPFDVVLSDMAPDTSGDPGGDSLRSIALCHALLDRLGSWLRPGGSLAMKVYEGGEYPALLKRAAAEFDECKGFKPKASRSESVEIFLVAKGFHGTPSTPLPPSSPRRGW